MKSFIGVAPESHFPIQNLPYGIFRPAADGAARAGVAIGDQVLDLSVLADAGLLDLRQADVFKADTLNGFLALGRETWRETRRSIQRLLASDTAELRDNAELRRRAFYYQSEVRMEMPVRVENYTDFYSAYHHAQNVGTMLRGPDNALMPNWKWLPVAYHGRASSIVVSGREVKRPKGQMKPPDADRPIFGPSRSLDYELEMACVVGVGNKLGEPISVDRAMDHIFGLVLMNDWSARDIQAWEYQPLGPFLAKNFCTSISPWIVPLEALEEFKRPLSAQDPAPLEYLNGKDDWTYDLRLEARLRTAAMKTSDTITRTNFSNLYWSLAQQLAHHTVNGCNLQPGDLLASGTISGEMEDSRGCMLELTWRGAKPLSLSSGETRKWLEDGDELTLTGWGEGKGYRVGFGEVHGRILPA